MASRVISKTSQPPGIANMGIAQKSEGNITCNEFQSPSLKKVQAILQKLNQEKLEWDSKLKTLDKLLSGDIEIFVNSKDLRCQVNFLKIICSSQKRLLSVMSNIAKKILNFSSTEKDTKKFNKLLIRKNNDSINYDSYYSTFSNGLQLTQKINYVYQINNLLVSKIYPIPLASHQLKEDIRNII